MDELKWHKYLIVYINRRSKIQNGIEPSSIDILFTNLISYLYMYFVQ